ncbi:ATPase, T2SS/T4P/T4SS family [Lautropia mirabilis]|uniref:ATPase, T2SS/T4P/T4SS family n=1 Tax=Lautropia mirabilis TaxID=47671 RepID=UPI0028E39B4B|nr:ATPase, T2SS/T4P/T4SS family [Lautropia mirabilis]
MLEIVIEEEGRESRTVPVAGLPCRIGRGKEAEVQLGGWRVARVHAELQRIGRGVKLVDLGTIVGTRVNGERVVEYGPLSERDEIVVAGYRLRVQGSGLRLAASGRSALLDDDGLETDVEGTEVLATQKIAPEGDHAATGAAASVRNAVSHRSEDAGTSGHGDGQSGQGISGRTLATPVNDARQAVEDGRRADGSPDGNGRASASGPDLVSGESRDPGEHRDSGEHGASGERPDAIRRGAGGADEKGEAPGGAGVRDGGKVVSMGAAADAGSRGADDSIDHVRLADYARAAQEQGKALGWRRLVQRQLLEVIDLRRSNLTQFSADEVKAEVRSAVERIVAGMQNLPPDIDRDMLVQDSVDEAVGLGPLERLMTDPLISEIMVNSATDIFVERKGKLQQVPLAFSDDDAIRNVIERIVAPLGRRIDESSPLVDARLPDGSRVNAIIPPVALKGPTITIRRFNRTVMTPDTLVANQSASPAMMEFLRICVEQHKSIIVSGGTGSGKTTLLNVLSNLIPVGERLITIEDAAELKLMHPHLVSLESRPPNAEGRGAITIRDLVKNALRMRPDRIIVGECRGGEALDMLQAMNTGHEGSMTTVHANTPRDVLSRLEVLMLMAGVELPLAALREQIASAVDLIIHQARFPDGSRRITSITEVCGVESGKIQSHEIFRYEQTGLKNSRVQGRFRACDEVPSFYEALRDRGVAVDFSIFEDDAVTA